MRQILALPGLLMLNSWLWQLAKPFLVVGGSSATNWAMVDGKRIASVPVRAKGIFFLMPTSSFESASCKGCGICLNWTHHKRRGLCGFPCWGALPSYVTFSLKGSLLCPRSVTIWSLPGGQLSPWNPNRAQLVSLLCWVKWVNVGGDWSALPVCSAYKLISIIISVFTQI